MGAFLQPGDLVWLETPLNPTCEVADIQAYVAAARAKADVHVVVDGTFPGSYQLFPPISPKLGGCLGHSYHIGHHPTSPTKSALNNQHH